MTIYKVRLKIAPLNAIKYTSHLKHDEDLELDHCILHGLTDGLHGVDGLGEVGGSREHDLKAIFISSVIIVKEEVGLIATLGLCS